MTGADVYVATASHSDTPSDTVCVNETSALLRALPRTYISRLYSQVSREPIPLREIASTPDV